MKTFQPGEIYFGTLMCAHSDFPVRCVRRTDKSVWFEHVDSPQHYPLRRAKVHKYENQECAMFHNWYISSTKQTGGDFDPLTI